MYSESQDEQEFTADQHLMLSNSWGSYGQESEFNYSVRDSPHTMEKSDAEPSTSKYVPTKEKKSTMFWILIAIAVASIGLVLGICLWQFLPKDDSTSVSTYLFNQCKPDSTECCNGLESNCPRRVNDVVFAASHNAMSSKDNGFSFANNNKSLEKSLEAGYRALLMDVCSCGNAVTFCHGDCLLGTRDPSIVFASIRDFLLQNTQEVLLVELQIEADDDNVVFDLFDIIATVGLDEHIYEHPGVDTPWPMMSELVKDNKRLIVFQHDGPDCNKLNACPTGLLNTFSYMFSTTFSMEGGEEVKDYANNCEITRGVARDNGFFLLNHFSSNRVLGSAVLVPDKRIAKVINQKNEVAERVQECSARVGQSVNLIAVDFWSVGDVLEVVQATNLPTSMVSSSPSDAASEEPSVLPSLEPSDMPSGIPSRELSSDPSAVPSHQPSFLPSSSPTAKVTIGVPVGDPLPPEFAIKWNQCTNNFLCPNDASIFSVTPADCSLNETICPEGESCDVACEFTTLKHCYDVTADTCTTPLFDCDQSACPIGSECVDDNSAECAERVCKNTTITDVIASCTTNSCRFASDCDGEEMICVTAASESCGIAGPPGVVIGDPLPPGAGIAWSQCTNNALCPNDASIFSVAPADCSLNETICPEGESCEVACEFTTLKHCYDVTADTCTTPLFDCDQTACAIGSECVNDNSAECGQRVCKNTTITDVIASCTTNSCRFASDCDGEEMICVTYASESCGIAGGPGVLQPSFSPSSSPTAKVTIGVPIGDELPPVAGIKWNQCTKNFLCPNDASIFSVTPEDCSFDETICPEGESCDVACEFTTLKHCYDVTADTCTTPLFDCDQSACPIGSECVDDNSAECAERVCKNTTITDVIASCTTNSCRFASDCDGEEMICVTAASESCGIAGPPGIPGVPIGDPLPPGAGIAWSQCTNNALCPNDASIFSVTPADCSFDETICPKGESCEVACEFTTLKHCYNVTADTCTIPEFDCDQSPCATGSECVDDNSAECAERVCKNTTITDVIASCTTNSCRFASDCDGEEMICVPLVSQSCGIA